jgi:arylsulfatase A-like enzyme
VTTQSVSDPPNIVFAFADDWGPHHASAYGDPNAETPAFDRVAEEGVLFENAYVSSPSCTPSRGAVLTGQHFWRNGTGANLYGPLPTDRVVYPDQLEQNAGYVVGWSGIKGYGPVSGSNRPRNPAGDRYGGSYEDERYTMDGLEAMMDEAAQSDSPFCFWWGSSQPHRTIDPDAGVLDDLEVDKSDVALPPYLPDGEAIREDALGYYAEVLEFDREVQLILDILERRGELENTIVVISGDHGWPLPRGKCNVYDSGMKVPLAIRWGDAVPGGRTVSDFVNLTDLAPTFLEAAGVSIPDQMTADSLVPLLTSGEEGRVEPDRDEVFFGKERHTPAQEGSESGGYPTRAIRTDDYLYVRNFEPDRWPVGTPDYQNAYNGDAWLGNTDNGPSKYFMAKNRANSEQLGALYDLSFGKRPEEELYDLRTDPHQMNNIADERPDVVADLRSRLMAELAATGDPRSPATAEDGSVFDDAPYGGGVVGWPGQSTLDAYDSPMGVEFEAFAEAYDNDGIAPAGSRAGDLLPDDDAGVPESLVAGDLADEGYTPGATVSVDGLAYEWPAGDPATDATNNVRCDGQRWSVDGRVGRLGFLGGAFGGGPEEVGEVRIRYVDGTTSSHTLGFTNAFFANAYSGNAVAATARLNTDGSVGDGDYTLEVAEITPETEAAVDYVELPSNTRIRLFAAAVGRPAPLSVGDGATPTDPDGDGQYEDVDGDGAATYNDVVSLFEEFDGDAVGTDTWAYDYNGNGRLDHGDIVALFESL